MMKVKMALRIQKTIEIPEGSSLDAQTVIDLAVYRLESRPLFEFGLIKELQYLRAAYEKGSTNAIVDAAEAVIGAFVDRRPESGWSVEIESAEEIDEQDKD
jgi:hypothetical protein